MGVMTVTATRMLGQYGGHAVEGHMRAVLCSWAGYINQVFQQLLPMMSAV